MSRKSRDEDDRRSFLDGLDRADRILRYLRPRDYEVGYGKPPPEHRFKPGQSGNPKGRPKGYKGRVFTVEGSRLRQALHAELGREVTIEERGRMVRVPALNLLLRKLMQKALSGQSRAAQILLDAYATAERDALREHRELVEAVMDYQAAARLEVRRRADEGVTGGMPILPHPDDIEVDPISGTIALHGPASETEDAASQEVAQRIGSLLGHLQDIQGALERDAEGTQRLPRGQREIFLTARDKLLAEQKLQLQKEWLAQQDRIKNEVRYQ